MCGRRRENRETSIIPGTCNDAVEDETELALYSYVLFARFHIILKLYKDQGEGCLTIFP